MVKVEIFSDSRYPVNRKLVRRAVLDTLLKNKITLGDIEVSVAVVGKRKMRELSKKYLKDDLDHEVLAFPYEDLAQMTKGFINPPDEFLRLGDIVLCWPQMVILAARDESMVEDEVYMLTAHATEHLLGKHHE